MPAFSSSMPFAPHRPMRRANRAVTDVSELRAIVEHASVLHVGSMDAEGLFVVPMSFGFEVTEADGAVPGGDADGARWTFWLHSAGEGRKADAWAARPEVALELDVPVGVIEGDYACAYSLAYESVMATGTITRVEDPAEKVHGLALLMEHTAPGSPVSFSPEAVARVTVWRIDVERLTGKRREAARPAVAGDAPDERRGKHGGHSGKHGHHGKGHGDHDGHGEKHGGHGKRAEKDGKARDASGSGAGKPSKKELRRAAERALGPERCPGCGHHCKLSDPSCSKGKKLRDRKLEKLGVKLG